MGGAFGREHASHRDDTTFRGRVCDLTGRAFKENECKWPMWRACRRAGLRKITWHVLRHTFASHLVMKGVPLKAVQELMGHATIEMTLRYSHLSPEVGRGAVQLLDRHGNGHHPVSQLAESKGENQWRRRESKERLGIALRDPGWPCVGLSPQHCNGEEFAA